MDYRRLGSTGVKISRLALGCGNFGGIGSAPAFYGMGETEAQACALMDRALDAGINVFDTANAYGGGRSEAFIGRWLHAKGAAVRGSALFVAGRVLFGVDITSNVFNLLLICLTAASACVAFGMLLAALAPTAAAANGMGTLLILIMSAVGGAWWPTSFMPPFMQQLSKFTIVYWSIEGFLRVLWANCNTRELLPVLAILLAFAAAANTISIWRFRHGQIFE